MNTTTDIFRCHYCYRPLTSDKLIFQAGSILRHLHSVCTHQLATDLGEQVDAYYNDKYLRKQPTKN